jgi:hypothetical protein
MENSSNPLDAIQTWQEWYSKNQVVASIDEPLVTKESREQLHDTSSAIDSLHKSKLLEKATTYFADTIAEYISELSPAELFSCLLKAATDNYNYTKGEYEHAKQFLNCIKNQTSD